MKLRREIEDVERFGEIAEIISRNGFGLLLDRLNLPEKFTEEKKASPERLRKSLQELGPAFIKFGQIISERPDLIPEEYIEELSKLQDESPAFSGEKAEKILEREVGLENFESFTEEPLASASIAQVHRATLESGEEVVVKVRRPGIKEKIERDFDIIKFLAKEAQKHVESMAEIEIGEVAEQFTEWTRQELDLRREMENSATLKENLSENEKVVIPEVYPGLTTEKVLTMEYIEVFKLENDELIEENGLDRHELALTGVEIGIKQIIADGFFHADTHESNFLLREDGKIVLLDFGMMGSIDLETRKNIGLLFLYIANEDADGCVEILTEMGRVTDNADLQSFKESVEKQILTLKNSTAETQTVSKLTLTLIQEAGRNGIKIPHSIVIVGKSMVTLEGIFLKIYPEMDLKQEYSKRIKKELKKQYGPEKLGKEFRQDLLENTDLISKAPSKLEELAEKNKKVGKVKIQRNLRRKILAASLLISSTILLLQVL